MAEKTHPDEKRHNRRIPLPWTYRNELMGGAAQEAAPTILNDPPSVADVAEAQAPASESQDGAKSPRAPPPVPDIGEQILSDADVHKLTQLSRTTRWRMGREGTFPLPVQLAKGRTGYLRSEILEWMLERPRVQPRSAA